MRRIAGLVVLLAAGCAVRGSTGEFSVAWSDGHSDSPGVPAPVVCGEIVSHPCPKLMYFREVDVPGDGTITWIDPSGGSNDSGVPVSSEAPITEQLGVALASQGSIVLAQHGDDAGLRHAAVLDWMPDGSYEGNVVWTLFTVAGNTTFHVVLQ